MANYDLIRQLLAAEQSGQSPTGANFSVPGGNVPAIPAQPAMPPAQFQSTPYSEPSQGDRITKALTPLLAILASSSAGFKAPHGGTTGSKGTFGKAMMMGMAAWKKAEESKMLMEQARQEREREDALTELKKRAADIDEFYKNETIRQRDEATALKAEDLKRKQALADANIAAINERADLNSEQKQKLINNEIFLKEHGYYPGYGYGSTFPPSAVITGAKPEPVESVLKTSADVVNATQFADPERRSAFNALNSATTVEQAKALYDQFAGALPNEDLIGHATQANYLLLYNMKLEELRKRPPMAGGGGTPKPTTGKPGDSLGIR